MTKTPYRRPSAKKAVLNHLAGKGASQLGAQADGLAWLYTPPKGYREKAPYSPVKVHWGRRGGVVDSTYTK